MSSWVKGSIEPGMLPGEYAVEMDTSDVGSISLFAPEDKVRVDQNLMSVQRLHDGIGSVLVRLPARSHFKTEGTSAEHCKRMIRSNLEIQRAIDNGRVIITPDPQPRSPEYSTVNTQ